MTMLGLLQEEEYHSTTNTRLQKGKNKVSMNIPCDNVLRLRPFRLEFTHWESSYMRMFKLALYLKVMKTLHL